MTRRLSLCVLAVLAFVQTTSPSAQIHSAGPVTIDTGQLTGALGRPIQAGNDIGVNIVARFTL
jgi:hypothetical protein